MFVVGGHGPMQDLAVDPDIGGLIGAFLGNPDKILAAVCHGPASFLSAHGADGNWLFKGRRLTAFTNEEENQSGFAGNAPWLLEDRLRLAGALYQAEAPDSGRGYRREPRDRAAELLRPSDRRRRHEGARSEGLSGQSCSTAPTTPEPRQLSSS